MRSLAPTLALLTAATTAAALLGATDAAAQDRSATEAEARDGTPLEEGRRAVSEGRLSDAFAAFHRATERSPEDADAWRALAEVAERLRVDPVALEAYARYLALAPEADDRAEIEGRVQALDQLARGARYVAEQDDEGVRLIVDWDGQARRSANVLVDWQGRPLRVRRTSELLSLAEWDGSLNASEGSDLPRDLMPFPSHPPRDLGHGLGRRLDDP